MRGERRSSLTARENEVLDLVRVGLTNEEIAQRLAISPDTVKFHVSQILSKLGVSTREEATALKFDEGKAWRDRLAAWSIALKLALAATAMALLASVAVLAWAVTATGSDETKPLVLATSTTTPTATAKPEPTPTHLPPGPTDVPWIDATPGPTPTEVPPPSRPDVRPCTAGDVVGSLGGGQGIHASQASQLLVFTNVSTTACKLEGLPTIQFLDQDGAPDSDEWHSMSCTAFGPCGSVAAILEPNAGQTPRSNYSLALNQATVFVIYDSDPGQFAEPRWTPCPRTASAIKVTFSGSESVVIPQVFGSPAGHLALASSSQCRPQLRPPMSWTFAWQRRRAWLQDPHSTSL
ncbi:MAG: LuxR C-terminal-related transcriptional regulator [Chloroflexota bacterium]